MADACEFRVGMRVRVRGQNRVGTVVALPKPGEESAKISLVFPGNKKVRKYPRKKLEAAPEEPEVSEANSGGAAITTVTTTATTATVQSTEGVTIGLLRNQLEYYFSPKNLRKDKFLVERIREGGVTLETLLSFKKVASLVSHLRTSAERNYVLQEAVRSAQNCHLKKGGTAVAPNDRLPKGAGMRRGGGDVEDGGPCKYFAAGSCNRGQRCALAHDNEMIKGMEVEWLALAGKEVGSTGRERSAWRTQPFDYYLVLDLEGKDEIIEFPVMCVEASAPSGLEVARFHRYALLFIRSARTFFCFPSLNISLLEPCSWIRPRYLFDGQKINEGSEAVPMEQCLSDFDAWLSTVVRSTRCPSSCLACLHFLTFVPGVRYLRVVLLLSLPAETGTSRLRCSSDCFSVSLSRSSRIICAFRSRSNAASAKSRCPSTSTSGSISRKYLTAFTRRRSQA